MAKSTIVAGILLLVGVGLLINAAVDFSNFSNFEHAATYEGESFKIKGELVLSESIDYDPITNPNIFSFHMKDENGLAKKVIFEGTKPQDFERSEEVVLTGYMKGDIFYANDMLLKCPSKYKDEEIRFRAES